MRSSLWCGVLAALAVCHGCTALRWPTFVPERRVLIDFEAAADTARLSELRDDCPYPTPGRARFRVVADGPGASGGHSLRLDYLLARSDVTPVGVKVALAGLDVSPYDRLELRIRNPAPQVDAPVLRVGFRRPEPGGRGLVQTGSFALRGITAEWATVSIPLRSMVGLSHWTAISEVFVAVAPAPAASRSGAYLVDDLTLVRTGEPGPAAATRPATPLKRAWLADAKRGTGVAARRRERLAGWPSRLLVPRGELPTDDTALLRRIAADTWRGLDALRDREHGLPLDTVSFGEAPEPESTRIGDYTNVTNIGLYLLDVVAAHELDLIDRDTARRRAALVLDTLESLDSHAGFFFNYYDTTSLERTTNFVSFIDSAWLSAGLIVLRSAFPELAPRATALIERRNFAFFYDESPGLMSHGYFVHLGVASEYHYGLFYTEARLGSLIAIGKGDVPAGHWQRMLRVFPAACSWQTQVPRDGAYEWGGVRYVPSWGGSMFEAFMPALVVDESRWAPDSLGANGVAHATIQRRWAAEVAAVPVWGSSPSRSPKGGYHEYGIPALGVRGYGGDVVTPHAAVLALSAAPAEAIANLRRLIELYDIYGEFGFYDAVDPRSGRVARDYLALDQSMILVSLANYLKPHCVQNHFARDPIGQRALSRLAGEKFFE